jgi:glycosyl transferase family 25
MIPVFVINLARSTDRAASIRAHLADLGVSFEFFPAIDGEITTAIQDFTVLPYRARRRNLSRSEIGCAASHLAVYRHIFERRYEFACVLEDDARLYPDTLALLDETFLRTVPSFDLLNLQGFRGSLAVRMAKQGQTTICAPLRSRNGCVAQIISRSGARTITSAKVVLDSPIDHFLYLSGNVPGLRLLNVRPAAVYWDRGTSVIGRQRASDRLPGGIVVETGRLVDIAMRRLRQLRSFYSTWGPAGISRIRFLREDAQSRFRNRGRQRLLGTGD